MTAGAGASPGIAIGPIYVIDESEVTIPAYENPSQAFSEAAATVANDLRTASKKAVEAGRTEAAEILNAQAMMAEDTMLASSVEENLQAGEAFGDAVTKAAEGVANLLATLDDPYLAARAADVGEIADRIRRQLAGVSQVRIANTEPSVIVAGMLTAADTAVMDPASILGLITETGGPTGHVAVIARSLAIPAVVGVAGIASEAAGVATVALDGTTGEISLDPDPDELIDFQARAAAHRDMMEAAAAYRGVHVEVAGRPIRVAANVGTPEDLDAAIAAEADGIGLFRTEFLFLGRSSPPTQDEQFALYRKAAAAFQDPVVIRSFDIGGDKPAGYIGVPDEENPFLGVRGVRLYEQEKEIFKDQVKAIARASTAGDVWLMIPMIATVADFLTTRSLVDEATAELDDAQVAWAAFKVGVMIEVPSAALIASRLAEHVDFFSIGTNDLTQYTMAADRTSGSLAGYADPLHPAVMQLCNLTARAALDAEISVAVCGEAGSDLAAATLFMDMGIDKLSVSSPRVDVVKAHIDAIVPRQDRLGDALAAGSAAEAREIAGRR
ncbi:MAG: phosphoenolpyruvate--protein phosphotransferase [Acidimicrobiia bacterium]|nr:phosphoenolpyruvate--protein phosphotransferase [Acidimicrobiia bacterium]